jgi:hypothetical protein
MKYTLIALAILTSCSLPFVDAEIGDEKVHIEKCPHRHRSHEEKPKSESKVIATVYPLT